MIFPGWLTIHVLGYGAAVLIVGGTGAMLIHEHDAKIRAEDKAIANVRADSIVAAQNQAAVAAQSARVETVTVALRSVIQPTRVLVDSAKKYIHDTVLVAKALDSAKSTIAACTELAQTCDQFRKIATDSLRSLANLLKVRDHEALVATTPLNPRFSRGLQLGAGVCLSPKKPVRGEPCASLTYGLHLRIF